jgi:hypothetical protein
MKFTNDHHLPKSLVRAVTTDDYKSTGYISVTALIGETRIRMHKKRHPDDIAVDISERMWLLLGTGVHAMIERASREAGEALPEIRLELESNGWVISGQPDLWEDGILEDYKVTSMFACLDGTIKPEWEAQLNIYKLMYDAAGFGTNKLQLICILRDWNRHQKGRLPINIKVFDVPKWDKEYTKKYIESRIELHRLCEGMSDVDLPACDRWTEPEVFAVMIHGKTRAVSLEESPDEALALINTLSAQDKYAKTKFYVSHRPAKHTRCGYCECRGICNLYKPEQENETLSIEDLRRICEEPEPE